VHQGALGLIDVEEGAANWCRQRAASVADQTANHSRWSPPKESHLAQRGIPPMRRSMVAPRAWCIDYPQRNRK
jgi:hypothetical protein